MKKNIFENSYLKLLKDSVGEDSVKQFKQETQQHISYINAYAGVCVPLSYTDDMFVAPLSFNQSFKSNYAAQINGLSTEWILARQRLVTNANILNNGWKVDWNTGDGNQSSRAYLFSSNYNSETNRFLIDQTYAVWKQCENGLIFKNRELARQFIEQNEEDLQIYFSL